MNVFANPLLAAVNDLLAKADLPESFFEHLAYRKVPREKTPVEIRATEQFSDLCPAESALMMKCL